MNELGDYLDIIVTMILPQTGSESVQFLHLFFS